MRTVPLWVGATDDAKVPPRVRVRIFDREGGRCWLSGRKIMAGEKWELEHRIALCNGGTHSEDNLAPALVQSHKIKTKADVREKAKIARIRKRHLGMRKPRTIRSWRRFDGTPVYAERER